MAMRISGEKCTERESTGPVTAPSPRLCCKLSACWARSVWDPGLSLACSRAKWLPTLIEITLCCSVSASAVLSEVLFSSSFPCSLSSPEPAPFAKPSCRSSSAFLSLFLVDAGSLTSPIGGVLRLYRPPAAVPLPLPPNVSYYWLYTLFLAPVTRFRFCWMDASVSSCVSILSCLLFFFVAFDFFGSFPCFCSALCKASLLFMMKVRVCSARDVASLMNYMPELFECIELSNWEGTAK